MDCRHARLLLEFARPHHAELEAADTQALKCHLADCPECGPVAQQERHLDDHLGRAMADVQVPGDLRNRLLTRLAVERDAWYRHWLMRSAGILLAAAAIVLLVWGGLLWRSGLRQPLDPEGLAQVGEAEEPSASPEDVRRWFKEKHGLRVVMPRDVDYLFFSHCALVEYRGKRVPMLAFIYNGNDGMARARVYIVTDDQFDDLEELVNQPPRGTRGYKIRVKASADNPHVYYMRVWTEGSESRFFKLNHNPAT